MANNQSRNRLANTTQLHNPILLCKIIRNMSKSNRITCRTLMIKQQTVTKYWISYGAANTQREKPFPNAIIKVFQQVQTDQRYKYAKQHFGILRLLLNHC